MGKKQCCMVVWSYNLWKGVSFGNWIYDNDFVSGIEFLIKEGVIMVSVTESGEKSDAVIPEWVKNNAAWWSEDIISEKEFLSGIEYLVNNGIIQVN